MSQLTGKQVRCLRALGHKLKPVVTIGKEATTDKVAAACLEQLACHELIKVKILDSCPEDRHEVADSLQRKTGAEVVQILGRTLLLYLQSENRIIALP